MWVRLFLLLALVSTLFECRRMRMKYTLTSHDEWVEVKHGGLDRKYLLHKPPEKKIPVLLVALHGGGGKAETFPGLTKKGFIQLADQMGFYIVYPQGFKKQWNDGRTVKGSYAHENQLDDVGFLRTIITYLKTKYHLEKVYVTGMSNGGFMSYFMACKAADLVDGIAAVTANLAVRNKDCRPARPLPVMIVNGTKDTLVPYEGGQVKVLGRDRGEILSTAETVKYWQAVNGCPGSAEQKSLIDNDNSDDTYIEKVEYTQCQPAIWLYRVVNGGHTWPGGFAYLPEALIGKTSHDMQATDEIVRFFINKK